jgi:hypothetical protein
VGVSAIQSSYVYCEGFNLAAMEYDRATKLVLVRCDVRAVVSCGFDLSPDQAIEFGQALIKHGEALKEKQTEEQ